MNLTQAIRIAIGCIERERAKFAFNANLYEHAYMAKAVPSCAGEFDAFRMAWQRYNQLTAAIQFLESLQGHRGDKL